MRIIPILFAALWLIGGQAFAEDGDIYLECRYSGFKSLYRSPIIFKIARDGYVYDGPDKMLLNRDGVIDAYLFGRTIDADKVRMHSIDIFNGHWSQYIITKDEVFRIRNIEEVTKNKVNSHAGLAWQPIGECKSVNAKN